MSEVPLYGRVYGLSTSGVFKKSLSSPLCDGPASGWLQGYLSHKKAPPPLGPC